MRFKSAMKKAVHYLVFLMFTLVLAGVLVHVSWANSQTTGEVGKWLAELEKRLPKDGLSNNPSKQAGSTIEKSSEQTNELSQWGPGYKGIKKISVDFYKVDLHNVFRLLGKVSGKNIVVDESVSGTLTLSLQNVPWTFVLEVIKNLKGLSSIERYNTIMIYPSSKQVTWAGEAGETGSLTLLPQTNNSEQDSSSGLIVERHNKEKTPIDQILKAEKFIAEGKKAEKQGQIPKALKFYKKASDIWKDNVTLAKKVASLSLWKGQDELSAFNYAKRALRTEPKDSEAATLAAVALARMGKNKQAIAYFERALISEKIPEDTLYNYAVFCFSTGKYRQAIRLLTRLESQYPITPEVMMLRARCYEGLKENEQAVSEYKAILQGGKAIPEDLRQFARLRLDVLASNCK